MTEFAKHILDTKIMTVGEKAYIPFVDSYNSNLDASKSVKWGSDEDAPLSQIYGSDDE